MANPNNTGTVVGKVAADPVFFVNDNGTKRVFLTVYARRDFKGRDGLRGADPVRLEAWVRAETDGIGVFEHVHRGDMVNVQYCVRSGEYADKATGEVIYFQQLHVQGIQLLDSRATTTARLAKRLSAAEQATQPEPAPAATKTRRTRQKAAQAA